MIPTPDERPDVEGIETRARGANNWQYAHTVLRHDIPALIAWIEALEEVVGAARNAIELEGGAGLIPLDVEGKELGPWQALVETLAALDGGGDG